MLERGEWRATVECADISVRGYHLSALYSPLGWYSWADAVRDHLNAKSDTSLRKTWVNTVLGETWEEDGEQADPDALIQFSENYDSEYLPDDILLLTAGVDTQDDRLEVQIVGWSDGGVPWVVSHSILWGDPGKDQVWGELDNYLKQTICGHKIATAFIDSGGHHTERVYAFTKKRHGRKIFPIKGDGGQKEPVSRAKQTAAQRVMLVKVGVDSLKRTLLGWLKEPKQQIHFSHTLDDEFYRQLTAEKMVVKKVKGFQRMEFQKTRDRNETLDCFIYAYAAMLALNVKWSALGKAQPVESTPEPAEEELSVVDEIRKPPRMRRQQRKRPSFVRGY